MIGRTKESWRRFGASDPGHRFRDRYRRQQESEQAPSDWGCRASVFVVIRHAKAPSGTGTFPVPFSGLLVDAG
jgi:hypothetical protein